MRLDDILQYVVLKYVGLLKLKSKDLELALPTGLVSSVDSQKKRLL